jgi:hypothetical protein
MKIEHITLGGNSVIRNTADILPTTRRRFDVIRISYESKVVSIPVLPLKLKITATEEGAAFDVMKGEDLAITNFCCFEEKYSDIVLNNIYSIADMYNKRGFKMKVIEPVTPQWLYSAVINPFALPPDQMSIAGEVELYIFEQLFLAKIKN